MDPSDIPLVLGAPMRTAFGLFFWVDPQSDCRSFSHFFSYYSPPGLAAFLAYEFKGGRFGDGECVCFLFIRDPFIKLCTTSVSIKHLDVSRLTVSS